MDADFLKDIIPYRCPKCGDSRKFTSLRDLKLHLNSEHAFKVGCVKPRARMSIFDHKGHNSKKKVANHENLSRQWSSSNDSRQSSSESYERDSSLLQSYKEDARMLESRLQNAREYEQNNKRRGDYLSRSRSYDPLDSALNKLNKDVMNSRRNNWQSTDALYNAEEVISGVETAAEERFQNQQNIIQNLVENLQQRELQLTNANQDIDKLRQDRQKLMDEIEHLFKSADFGNKKLLQELETKEKELNSVNNELSYIKKKTSDEIKQKDEKLLEAERSLRQLECDRKTLENERENLMEKVQMDSGLLRETLQVKENQVRMLNIEMESMKKEQDEMLSESIQLYNSADHGTSKLKDMVKQRDKQLHEAEEELNRLKQLNERLVWESRQLTEQADSHSQILHELLRQREDELAAVKEELQSIVVQSDQQEEQQSILQSDRPKMINEQIKQLQLMVLEKTALLEEKEKELQSLKEFLISTAEKESVAREKLEKFISDLIDRADKAEKQLQCLKKYIADEELRNQDRKRHDGKLKCYMTSGGEDSDSDDEMSDDLGNTAIDNPKTAKYSQLRRQVPVKKKKNVHLENSKLQGADGSTVPYSPSPCDSGFHDSKLGSSRSSNPSSSLNQPNYMNDINLRTKFCNDPNLSKHGQHLKQESQQELYEGSHGKHQEKKYEQSSTNRTGRKFDKSYPYVDKRILASNDSQRPSLDSRYTNQGRPNAYVSTGNNADNHNNHGDLNVRRQPLNDNITYIPCDRFTGQSVENIEQQSHYPMKYQNTFSRSNSSDSILVPSHQHQAASNGLSQQNTRSLSSPEYQELPTKSTPIRSLSSSEYQELPTKSIPISSLSSSTRQRLPDRHPDYRKSLSSSERQALPNRHPNYGMSISSSDRQKLPGQGGDNSLSDVLSITDYVSEPVQSENNSFQKIMDENGILWETEMPSKQTVSSISREDNCHDVQRQLRGGNMQYETSIPKSRQNNYPETNRQTCCQSQNTASKLKMSDKFLEERKIFSENLKRILKLPFLRESGNQVELTDDTLRNKLGKDNFSVSKRNLYTNSSDDLSYNSQTMASNDSLDRNFEADIRTKECSTQTWIIDRNYMDVETSASNSSPSLTDENLVHHDSSPRMTDLVHHDSSPRMIDNKLLDDTTFSANNSSSISENNLPDSETYSSTLYSKLPENKRSLKNRENGDNLVTLQNNDKCYSQELSKKYNSGNNEKSRDLFDELKKESFMENNAIVKPSIMKKNGGVREKDKISQTVNLKGHALSDNSVFSETSVSTESGDLFTSTKPSNIKDIGQRYQHTEAHSLESVGNYTYENNQSTKSSDSSNDLEQNMGIMPMPETFIQAQEEDNYDILSDLPHQQDRELGTNDESSVIFSSQMSDDFEIIDTQTEEEVDSVIYDKSTDSTNGNKMYGQDSSVVLLDDTVEDDIIPPQEDVMLACDRRKSLSRQMSLDVGRNAGKDLLEQFTESDIRTQPLGMMIEETLTPESLDTFFAQPEVEIEDEYHHSVSSMDGFTLSRSSSQDSLLSERMSHYSKREATRKRRQALCHIFNFLDTESLINVALVCREWKKISRHPSLWKHVYLRNQKCSVEFLMNIAKWCTSMETLHLEGVMVRNKQTFEIQEEYNNRTRYIVVVSSIGGGNQSTQRKPLICHKSLTNFITTKFEETKKWAILEPGLERLLQVSESTLKTANIIHCENIITDKGLWLVSCYSRMVRKVTYICNTDLPGADVIWALGAGCRDITYLNISMTDPSSSVGVKFNNKCLQVISQFCQDLQTLCIGGTEIDINGLVLLAKSCQRLLRLELHYGTMVTEDTMVAVCRLGLHNLQQICFNFTPVEAKAILHLCKSSKHLQKVQISLDISCFDLKGELKEDDKMKKYADMVKILKELEKKPGVGNILKLSCGEVFINTDKKFFGLF